MFFLTRMATAKGKAFFLLILLLTSNCSDFAWFNFGANYTTTPVAIYSSFWQNTTMIGNIPITFYGNSDPTDGCMLAFLDFPLLTSLKIVNVSMALVTLKRGVYVNQDGRVGYATPLIMEADLGQKNIVL